MKPNLKINTELARKILVDFIHSEVTRTGFFKKAVIGVSGGIDSAVSLMLAADALGAENVLAVRMPYKSSSTDSLDHAALVIEKSGVLSKTIEITALADGLIEQFPEMGKLRRGNIMARSRMIVLYDQSADFEGLVIGTSNKTEILLGYSTQWGDAASALNPIGDLYKAQLRQLARAIGVPQPLIDKPPSADLWSGQTDEDELGFTYEDADRLLYYLVDERYTPDECIEMGFDADFVAQVVRRVRGNHYKRVMPPIAKLSNRTIGVDFLYLRDWGS